MHANHTQSLTGHGQLRKEAQKRLRRGSEEAQKRRSAFFLLTCFHLGILENSALLHLK